MLRAARERQQQREAAEAARAADRDTAKGKRGWKTAAAAGLGIGSAAVIAALLYANRGKIKYRHAAPGAAAIKMARASFGRQKGRPRAALLFGTSGRFGCRRLTFYLPEGRRVSCPAIPSTSDDILTCARSLIVTGGYNGFSYADVARVVGIRKASIHHHFPAKADLVRVLVARYREEAQKGLEAIGHHHADPADQLCAYAAF